MDSAASALTLVDLTNDWLRPRVAGVIADPKSAKEGLQRVKELLEECEAFLHKLRHEDIILGKLIEYERRGFTRHFRKKVRE